jgi:hypothetical protein
MIAECQVLKSCWYDVKARLYFTLLCTVAAEMNFLSPLYIALFYAFTIPQNVSSEAVLHGMDVITRHKKHMTNLSKNIHATLD